LLPRAPRFRDRPSGEAATILRRVVDALDRSDLTALDIDQCDDVDPHFDTMHALVFIREAG
jgi:hypothetical protein